MYVRMYVCMYVCMHMCAFMHKCFNARYLFKCFALVVCDMLFSVNFRGVQPHLEIPPPHIWVVFHPLYTLNNQGLRTTAHLTSNSMHTKGTMRGGHWNCLHLTPTSGVLK